MVRLQERPTPVVGEPLPRAHLAVADPERFTGYLLSETHPRGQHKARVFRSALGFDRTTAAEFRLACLEGVRSAPVREITPGYGKDTWKCEVHVDIQGPNGQIHTVVTAWEATLPPKPPRFLTAYLKKT